MWTMRPSMFMSGSPGQVPHSFGPGHGAAAEAAVLPSVAGPAGAAATCASRGSASRQQRVDVAMSRPTTATNKAYSCIPGRCAHCTYG